MDEYRQASDLVNPSKLIVIPAGVEVPKKCVQHTSGLRARLGIPEDTLIVSSHGRLDPIKRFDLVLGAFAASTMAMPNAHLVIAGPDQHRIRGSLEDLALRLGVANRVHFMGQCTAAEIQELLLESDVWVSASATESLGIAALEALAAGCSTIASAAVPVGVEAAGLGAALLFSHPQELASLMANLLVDERRRSELSRRADEFSRRYNWQHIGPQFVDLYRSLV
jgi:D-inositol-3-phosphate glycosyltransferase